METDLIFFPNLTMKPYPPVLPQWVHGRRFRVTELVEAIGPGAKGRRGWRCSAIEQREGPTSIQNPENREAGLLQDNEEDARGPSARRVDLDRNRR